jgi:hypothetical protein
LTCCCISEKKQVVDEQIQLVKEQNKLLEQQVNLLEKQRKLSEENTEDVYSEGNTTISTKDYEVPYLSHRFFVLNRCCL